MAYFGKEIKKLGFGFMRLPMLEDGETTDIEQTKQMVDRFMAAGCTYFDTAYVYGKDGESEKAMRASLVERYPRDSFTIATKLNAWLACNSEEEAKQQIYTSLERLGTDYVDFYLLHAIQDNNWKVYEDWHLWEYMEELKEKGLVKHWGFSFHATPELLEETLTKHPGAEFVQLQINYADMENPAVQSRACYEVARKHGKPVVVMEPVKGGTLATPPTPVEAVFKDADPNASNASWAIRYVATLDGVMTVLSGMSTLEQMEDNLSYMKDFQPLSRDELTVIGKAQKALDSIDQIKCTACHYCMPGCPMNIPIPDFFEAMNWHKIYGKTERAKGTYKRDSEKAGVKASECIACGQCEGACPQRLPIISLLEEVVATLED
ncbi:MAG: aldo/keto reductase [Clostridia bacterium]|nr:aldo/keto reductase [Clostridia bacterium]